MQNNMRIKSDSVGTPPILHTDAHPCPVDDPLYFSGIKTVRNDLTIPRGILKMGTIAESAPVWRADILRAGRT
jgi:hypothetical protein